MEKYVSITHKAPFVSDSAIRLGDPACLIYQIIPWMTDVLDLLQ